MTKYTLSWVGTVMAAFFLVGINSAIAADYQADPSNYIDRLAQLQQGDTLHLAAGTYEQLLNITNLNGTQDDWITITGPESGDPAVFVADPGPCCNTIEITNSSYVAIQHITVDGNHVSGAFGLSAKNGTSNLVHHIRVAYCTFINHDASQQTVAISTKAPTWGWVIDHNHIVDAGTGLYLGNSNGTMPFVAGIIEYNLIENTVGYNMEIKWQKPRPQVEGMPTLPQSTIIRHNVFIKNDRPSPDGDRPNLLVGGFPDSGPGSDDLYVIYGNFFYHNPRESLIQASGRVSIHDNVFVNVPGTAILLRNHDLPLKLALVYNNTIYAAGRGIALSSTAVEDARIVGNLVFSDNPISGYDDWESTNIGDSPASASNYVSNPSETLGNMDFYPLSNGSCTGLPLPLRDFVLDDRDHEWDLDFNGTNKGDLLYRGAYSKDGTNPGWALDRGIKDEPDDSQPNPDGGTSDAGTSDAGTSDAGTFDAGTSDAGTSDAGTSDAGTSDAGTSDAGLSDGGSNQEDSDIGGDSSPSNSDAGSGSKGISGGCGCHTESRTFPVNGLLWILLLAFTLMIRTKCRTYP